MAHAEETGDAPGTWTRHGVTGMSRTQIRNSLLAALLLFLAGLFTVRGFLPALAWAAVLAIGVWPLYGRMAHRWPKHKHALLPGLVVLACVLVFLVPLALIVEPLARDSHSALQWLQQARENGVPPPDVLQHLPYGARLTALWQQNLGQPGGVSNLAGHAMTGQVASTGRRIGAEALHRLVLAGFVLLGLFFLLRDAEDVTEQLRVAALRAFGPAGEDVGKQMIRSVHGTVDGLVLVGLGEGVLMGLAYWAAGLPHPTLFGLFTAILAMVPFGAALAFLVAGLVLLATGKAVAAGAVVAAGFVVSFIADHFLRPALIGGATKLPFLWVLLGILGGVEAWGLVGLFLGPAIMAALILLWREWIGSQRGPINPAPADLVKETK